MGYGLAARGCGWLSKVTGSGRPAAKDRALEYVKTQVLTGAFPGGELLSEVKVAAALGMSRIPRPGVPAAGGRGAAPVVSAARRACCAGALGSSARSDRGEAGSWSSSLRTKVVATGAGGMYGGVRAVVHGAATKRDAAAAPNGRRLRGGRPRRSRRILKPSGNAILSGFYSSLRDRRCASPGNR